MKLRDRTAIVTGASRGIGRAIALAFAREGASVALGARSREPLAAVASEIEKAGGRAMAVELDVTSQPSVEAAKNGISTELGRVHVIVNNAGIAQSAKLVDMDDAHWQAHLDVNLTGTFRVTRAFLPDLIDAGWGRVINIASTAGKIGFQYTAAYCASKHGVIGLTRTLALEMATKNITANAICPGFVDTDMATAAAENIAAKTGGSADEARKRLEKMSPQNRLITAEEVAALAVMLASDEARGINGQALNVDGGAVVY